MSEKIEREPCCEEERERSIGMALEVVIITYLIYIMHTHSCTL